MSVFAVILSAIVILHASDAAESGKQSDTESSPSLGAKQAGLFSQAPFDNRYTFPIDNVHRPLPNRRCPLCDSSVYPYCGEKLLHDACCCTDPYIHNLPYQCKLADCRFLHANNCREHKLIATCCCSDDYRSLLRSFSFKVAL
ncbi:uncharacterized protein LOC143179270 [Calliopsis andreniformis]|uniref:uncharacterized protein LOC143179270 n=1 Tax=Calliopsis andreniformis TaxID=337506 RepID=UPI003FCCFDE7